MKKVKTPKTADLFPPLCVKFSCRASARPRKFALIGEKISHRWAFRQGSNKAWTEEIPRCIFLLFPQNPRILGGKFPQLLVEKENFSVEKRSFDRRRGEAPCFSTGAVEAESPGASGKIPFIHKTAPLRLLLLKHLFFFLKKCALQREEVTL